jgi:SWI/SNF-related matrix-associated actin-dependent regulator of chromatin subfamily A3
MVLVMMTRLRQLCDHQGLVPHDFVSKLKDLARNEESAKVVEILRAAVDSGEECIVCLDELSAPVITPCKHYYCRECILRVLQNKTECPMCRRNLAANMLTGLPPEESAEKEDENIGSSSKIDELLKILANSEVDSKTVVFSQWSTMLDKVQSQLKLKKIKYYRFDGAMSAGKREASLEGISKLQRIQEGSRRKRAANISKMRKCGLKHCRSKSSDSS